MQEVCGVIYILTNPSFPDYVKIGYADKVEERVKVLNSSPAVPFAFRIYATFDVTERLSDKKLHKLIDTLNPELRSREEIDGKIREKEFYHIRPEEIYSAFESMVEVNGTRDRLHLWQETKEEKKEQEVARNLANNRHHFKDITFSSSLTGKVYYSKTKEDGTLGIYEKETNKEVLNNSTPSKRSILYAAVADLNGDLAGTNTLYQLQHKLEKLVVAKD